MKVAIVSNLIGEKGLAKDAAIFADRVRATGHEPVLFDFRRDVRTAEERADEFGLAIFCEVLEPPFFGLAPVRWYVPNPEWHLPHKTPHLASMDLVLCKTQEAMPGPWYDKARLLGFESEDLGAPRFLPRRFLHPAGGSICRGTAAVLQAWTEACGSGSMPPDAELTIVDPPDSGEVYKLLSHARQVRTKPRLPESEFRDLQRSAGVHVIGSEYEGWGHLFWEALGLGARVLATDGPWWAAARGGFDPISAMPSGVRHLAQERRIDPHALAGMLVAAAAPAPPNTEGRRLFEAARDSFRGRFAALLEEHQP